jgi:hypothetical protein
MINNFLDLEKLMPDKFHAGNQLTKLIESVPCKGGAFWQTSFYRYLKV